MKNRQQRRATQAIDLKLKPVPNISGCDQACVNCRFSPTRALADEIQSALDHNAGKIGTKPLPPLPADEVLCLRNTTSTTKKTWGWCGEWKVRDGK